MEFTAIQVACAIEIVEALRETSRIEWHKGLCSYIETFVKCSEPGLLQGTHYLRFVEVLHDAIFSWKDYSGNPCYPVWLKTHKGTPHSQWDAVFSKEASEALQANYTAKRKQLARHIVVTLTEKYNV